VAAGRVAMDTYFSALTITQLHARQGTNAQAHLLLMNLKLQIGNNDILIQLHFKKKLFLNCPTFFNPDRDTWGLS